MADPIQNRHDDVSNRAGTAPVNSPHLPPDLRKIQAGQPWLYLLIERSPGGGATSSGDGSYRARLLKSGSSLAESSDKRALSPRSRIMPVHIYLPMRTRNSTPRSDMLHLDSCQLEISISRGFSLLRSVDTADVSMAV